MSAEELNVRPAHSNNSKEQAGSDSLWAEPMPATNSLLLSPMYGAAAAHGKDSNATAVKLLTRAAAQPLKKQTSPSKDSAGPPQPVKAIHTLPPSLPVSRENTFEKSPQGSDNEEIKDREPQRFPTGLSSIITDSVEGVSSNSLGSSPLSGVDSVPHSKGDKTIVTSSLSSSVASPSDGAGGSSRTSGIVSSAYCGLVSPVGFHTQQPSLSAVKNFSPHHRHRSAQRPDSISSPVKDDSAENSLVGAAAVSRGDGRTKQQLIAGTSAGTSQQVNLIIIMSLICRALST